VSPVLPKPFPITNLHNSFLRPSQDKKARISLQLFNNILKNIVLERDQLGDPGVVGRIILKLTFRKWDVGL
jgi:hypothetical protein